MFEKIQQDLRRSYYREVSLWRLPVRFITLRGFRAVAIFRMANCLYRAGVPWLPLILTMINEEFHTVAINHKADIGAGLTLPHAFGITVSPGVKIGPNAQIFHGVGIGSVKGKFPTIGSDFVAYASAQIAGGLIIGDRVTIGANCTIITDIDSDNTVAQGRNMVIKKEVADDE